MRRSKSPVGVDTPFVDLAFALAGPVILLMMIFLLLFARQAPLQCQQLEGGEAAKIANDLREWRLWAEERLEDERKTAVACGVTAASGTPFAPAVVPGPLVGICPDDAAAAVERSGSTIPGLTSLASRVAQQGEGLADCVTRMAPDCLDLTDAELRDRASELRAWLSEAQRRTRDLVDVVKVAGCTVDKPEPSTLPRQAPPPLQDLCPIAAAAVLDAADLEKDAADAAAEALKLAEYRAASCLGPPDCLRLSAEALAERAKEVRKWVTWALDRARELNDSVSTMCGSVDNVGVNGVPIWPVELEGLCASSRQAVINQSGQREAALQRAGLSLSAAMQRVAQCTGRLDCATPSDDELNQRAVALNEWRRDMQASVDGLLRDIADTCLRSGADSGALSGQPDSGGSSLSPPIGDLCPGPRDEVLRLAGLDADSLAALGASYDTAYRRAAECIRSTGPPQVTISSSEISFPICSSVPELGAGASRKYDSVDEIIREKAREVLHSLRNFNLSESSGTSGGSQWRIEVAGHADSDPIGVGGCINRAGSSDLLRYNRRFFDNRELSIYRAYEIARRFEDVLTSEAEGSRIGRLLNNRQLRVVVAGVSDAEPRCKQWIMTEACKAENRRIEIRIVSPPRQGQRGGRP